MKGRVRVNEERERRVEGERREEGRGGAYLKIKIVPTKLS